MSFPLSVELSYGPPAIDPGLCYYPPPFEPLAGVGLFDEGAMIGEAWSGVEAATYGAPTF